MQKNYEFFSVQCYIHVKVLIGDVISGIQLTCRVLNPKHITSSTVSDLSLSLNLIIISPFFFSLSLSFSMNF